MAGEVKIPIEQAKKNLEVLTTQASLLVDELEKISGIKISFSGDAGTKISAQQKQIESLKNQIKGLDDVEVQSLETKKQLVTAENNLKKSRLAEIKLQKAREDAIDKFTKKEAAAAKKREAQVNKESQLRQRLLSQRKKEEAATLKEVKVNNKLAEAYNKLNARRTKSKNVLRNLIASEKASNKEIKKAQKEFDILDKKVRKADRATRDFGKSVGNYKSAFGKAGAAVRSFVGVLGIYSALQIGKEIFTQIRALEALDKALKVVTETSENYVRAQSFIKDVAEETGIEYENLTKSYTKFLASAKTTNLTVEQTENIFRKVAKAGAVLGLSQDDVNGSFRALEQILSKGTVQAEEIRGQLGERLPGAFQILAKSMGLTTQELNKQLELGNVISQEVLPGFADELEKTFGLDKSGKVDTLNAAIGRLHNAWVDFLQGIEGGEGVLSNFIKEFFKLSTKIVIGFTIMTQSAKQFRESLNDSVKSEIFIKEIEAIKSEAEKTGKSLQDVAKESAKLSKSRLNEIAKEKREIELFFGSLEEITEGLSKSQFSAVESGQYIKAKERLEELERSAAGYAGALEAASSFKIPEIPEIPEGKGGKGGKEDPRERAEALEVELITIAKLKAEYEGQIRTLRFLALLEKDPEKKKAIEEEITLWEKKLNTLNQGKMALKGIIENYDDQLDRVKALIDLEASQGNNVEVARLTEIKKALEDNLKLIKSGKAVQLAGQKDIVDGMNSYLSILKTTAEIEKTTEEERIERLQKIADALQIVNDFQNAFADLGIALTERRIVKLEEERDAFTETIDLQIEEADRLAINEEEKEEKKRLLEEEKVRKQKEIDKEIAKEKTKQAKIDKAAALTQAAISTAVAALRSLERTPLPAGAIPFALTLALGAVHITKIAAQPIPKFKMGKESSKKYEGFGIVNDGGKQEFRQNKKGIEAFEGTNTLTWVNSDDIIHPNLDAMLDYNLPKIDYDGVQRAALMTSLQIDRDKINNIQSRRALQQNLNNERFKNDVKEILKGWKFNNNIDNTGVGQVIADAIENSDYTNNLLGNER